MDNWSIPSLRAAFDRIGSIIALHTRPPGEVCHMRGRVLVITEIARCRMARG